MQISGSNGDAGGEDAAKNVASHSSIHGNAYWSDLKAHVNYGTLLFVDPSLPLDECGQAFITDDAEQIRKWMECGDVVKLEPLHAAQWDSEPPLFEAMVVSPFILCRPVPKA